MSWHSIINATVTLYSWIDREAKQQVYVCAKLPSHDYDNQRIDLLDWKIDNGIVRLTYRTSDSAEASIRDANLPVVWIFDCKLLGRRYRAVRYPKTEQVQELGHS